MGKKKLNHRGGELHLDTVAKKKKMLRLCGGPARLETPQEKGTQMEVPTKGEPMSDFRRPDDHSPNEELERLRTDLAAQGRKLWPKVRAVASGK
ncbi:hypothetical protein NDU88_003641 [Pleurodeles waltl]|uniref:Uncharacterized protein n=1 Tax=Pleurodeles waltl TaxID=8319 RepID=A0AAV7SGH3_PLEWA|nr:hypothetical protein NDU88_003641 [Pleurodeles waltl]